MFDKIKFAKTLNDINNTYDSMTEFAKHSGVNRTYLSQYINQKLDAPPSPKILEKISKSSNGVTTYQELMDICGFLNNVQRKSHEKILDFFGFINYDDSLVNPDLFVDMEKYHFDYKDIVVLTSILKDFSLFTNETDEKIDLSSYINIHNIEASKKIIDVLKKYSSSLIYLYHRLCIDDGTDGVITSLCLLLDIKKTKYYMCPVYGRISAGQPNWVEECIEGTMPLDPDMMNITNPTECFFLRVNGESMNKEIKNGAYALIRKTDFVENGEIAVILVNGFDATLKKFSKQGDLIILEPMSDDPTFTTQVYNKDTEIKVIGKYIGKMEMK